jgi:hypothetical protein
MCREDFRARGGLGFSEALTDLRRIAKTGNSIYIVSDFHDIDENGLRQLYELSRHNSITAFLVFDPLERELPLDGLYAISDGSRELQIDTGAAQRRQLYSENAAQQSRQLHAELGKLGIPLAEIATPDSAIDALSRLFQRTRRRSSVA